MNDSQSQQEVNYAHSANGLYPIIVAVFVSLLLISNIGAVKLIQFGGFITDGGLFLFPLVYIVGDILSEVYGFKAARRAIYTAFSMAVLASFTFWLVQISPPASDWPNQESFEAVLGFVPRIVLASIIAFFVGQLLNAYVLVKIKERTKEKSLWLRLMGSTVVGQFVDTLIFCTIAFYGVITGATFLSYVAFGFVYKTLVEFLMVPITYQVIKLVKRNEPSYELAE
jgi:queuosine precursor transporter